MLEMKPPIRPSRVLLGLNFGRNGVFPKLFPVKYAAVSKTAILKIMTNKNILDSFKNLKHIKQNVVIRIKPIQKLENVKFEDRRPAFKNIW